MTSGVLDPVANVSVLLGFRVRRLGYYDHTQRQLGERALYVFPAKGEATRITCEGPEGVPVLPEDPVARKVKRSRRVLSWRSFRPLLLLPLGFTDCFPLTAEEDVQEGFSQENRTFGSAR